MLLFHSDHPSKYQRDKMMISMTIDIRDSLDDSRFGLFIKCKAGLLSLFDRFYLLKFQCDDENEIRKNRFLSSLDCS